MTSEKALYLDKVFPDTSFLHKKYKSYENIKDSCIFVLDTNALLAPYRASSKSFDDIKTIYNKLKDENRLQIPFRTLQEYVKNRGVCLQEQYSHFDKMSNSSIYGNFETELQIIPLLQTYPHFIKFNEIAEQICKLIKERTDEICKILCTIKELYWNDPIFEFYQNFISDGIIAKIDEKDLGGITDEMNLRYTCDIPPGFADQKKIDGGIGDLIIWKTILSLGTKSNIVFVSNDRNKNDWFYVSEVDKKKTPVAPRFELLFEFSYRNPEYSVGFIDFPTFLESQKAQSETVNEFLTPYDIIAEDSFMQELKEAYHRFSSTGGFLSSKYFVETYLATQGYDIRASWSIYYRLKEKGCFFEYQHSDTSGQYLPLNAIRLMQP